MRHIFIGKRRLEQANLSVASTHKLAPWRWTMHGNHNHNKNHHCAANKGEMNCRDSKLVSLRTKREYDVSFSVVDGYPITVGVSVLPCRQGDGPCIIIIEEWKNTVTGVTSELTISRRLDIPISEPGKVVALGLHIESYAREFNRLLSRDDFTMEQAASMALCYTPGVVADCLDGIHHGRADSIVANGDESPFPLKYATRTSNATADDTEVPVYEDAFVNLFNGTAVHASIATTNFVALETRSLRELCSMMLPLGQPGEVLCYCANLRERIISFKEKFDQTPHTRSVLTLFEQHEVEYAEAFFRQQEYLKSETAADPGA